MIEESALWKKKKKKAYRVVHVRRVLHIKIIIKAQLTILHLIEMN